MTRTSSISVSISRQAPHSHMYCTVCQLIDSSCIENHINQRFFLKFGVNNLVVVTCYSLTLSMFWFMKMCTSVHGDDLSHTR